MLAITVLTFCSCFTFSIASYGYSFPVWQQYFPERRMFNIEKIYGRTPRIRTGQGRYRMLPTGAELICQFPDNMPIMSNVVWERADLGALRSLDRMYKYFGETREFSVFLQPRGSTLKLYRLNPLDKGLYRCIATAIEPKTGSMVTLFQDVPFYPNI